MDDLVVASFDEKLGRAAPGRIVSGGPQNALFCLITPVCCIISITSLYLGLPTPSIRREMGLSVDIRDFGSRRSPVRLVSISLLSCLSRFGIFVLFLC